MVELYENGGESTQKPRDKRTPACGVSMWLGHLTAWLLVSGIDFSKKEHFEKNKSCWVKVHNSSVFSEYSTVEFTRAVTAPDPWRR